MEVSGKDHSSGGTRAASVFPDGGSGAADEVDTSMRGLLPAVTGTLPLRDRGDSNEDSDSSAIDSDEEERTGEYKFDPITEYMINTGRQNGRLDAAWDFYAKYTLPKFVRDEDSYRLLEPGEDGGQFYHLWKTPVGRLGDFGIGVALYFQTLAVMGVVFLVAGLANTWSLVYFREESYSGGQDQINEEISKGSAACTLREVVCLDSLCNNWTQNHRPCLLDVRTGLIDFFTTIALFTVLICLGKAQSSWARKLDMAEQTTSDYSVLVEDPNPSDTRPGTWRKFFNSRFGHVTYVTTAVECSSLVNLLRSRFEILQRIRIEAEGGEEEEQIAKDVTAIMSRDRWPAPCWKLFLMKYGIATDIVYWHDKLVDISREIEKETSSRKACSKVFVTFEKEKSQRKCLKAMRTGFFSSRVDHQLPLSKKSVVLNGNVLSVSHAPEPDDVIWENLEFGLSRRLQEFATRLLLTVVVVGVLAMLIYAVSAEDAGAAAIFIAVNNVFLPKFVTAISVKEHHHTHSTYQASLMLKIVISQWMNTAFIIYFVHNILTSPNEEYINQISKILWADAFTKPLLQVLDPVNRLKQLVIAPLSKTQAKMNSFFMGSKMSMAERYASMLKTLFVCLFFSAIFPQGYYVASMAMFMAYWSSKYCLFNRWKRPPPINDSLAALARRYFAIALVIHVVVSLQFYAGWPFDDLCPTEDVVEFAFHDEASVNFNSTEEYSVSSVLPQVGDTVYEVCSQDSPLVWGELPKSWMPDDQLIVVWIFSTFGIASTAIVGFVLFGTSLWAGLKQLCCGVYDTVGHAKSARFTEVDQINAYVPEVPYKKTSHPLLACDIGKMNKQHISWTGDYQAYNLCAPDAFPGLSRKNRASQFSRIVSYPPPPDA